MSVEPGGKSLVGRIAGPPAPVVVAGEVEDVLGEEPGGYAQIPDGAQTRSVWQHPPPKDEGHGLLSDLHAKVGCVVGGSLEVVVIVLDSGGGGGTEVVVRILVVDVVGNVGVTMTVVMTLTTPTQKLVLTVSRSRSLETYILHPDKQIQEYNIHHPILKDNQYSAHCMY